MPLYLIKQDIVKLDVDAIVNPTDALHSGGGGLDRHIQRNAGPGLWLEVMEHGKELLPGHADITKGYDLKARYVIHTRGPVWQGGDHGEARVLAECYRNCLSLAWDHQCRTVAFPLIAGGTFGFPNDDALRIAFTSITEYLQEHDMSVWLALPQSHTFNMGTKIFRELTRFVNENRDRPEQADLEDMLRERAETFPRMLERLRQERGMTAPQLYKKAFVSKAVHSKILTSADYSVSKRTAMAYGLALELDWEDFCRLIEAAGYSMTRHSTADIVIEYCVRHGVWDIFQVNEALFETDPDLPLLGC